jgi:hypothetical protein
MLTAHKLTQELTMIDIEHLRNVNTVSRFFNKCQALDQTLREMGKKPVAHKEAQRYIKPFMALSEQAKAAQNLEEVLDPMLIAFNILKES